MAQEARGNLETILVVDDDKLILSLVCDILERGNYLVLKASSGSEALRVASRYLGRIDLLMSDVKMPEMSGPDLGERLKQTRPDMHVMFMSGYSGGDLLVLNYGWAFIEKPFLPVKLLEMIHVVLHTPDRSQQPDQFDTRKDDRPLSGKE